MGEKKKAIKNKTIILSVFAISVILLSSVTFVPHINGSTATENFEDTENLRDISQFLSQDYLSTVSHGQYMMTMLIHQLLGEQYYGAGGLDVTEFQDAAENIQFGNMAASNNHFLLQENIDLLLLYLSEKIDSPDFSLESSSISKALQGVINQLAHLASFLSAGDSQLSNPSPWIENQNLIGQGLINIIMLIIMFILFLLDGGFIAIILGAASAILSGIVFILGALATIAFLLIAGVQGFLSLAAIFVFLLGIISKVVINILATLGAPFIAFLTWKLVGLLGSIMGRLSLGVLSLAALVLLLGLPIALTLIVLTLLQGNGGDTTPRLAVILEIIFSILLNIPGFEEPLHNIWDWFGERIDNWPEWPFDTLA
jgi:hypothetical protein